MGCLERARRAERRRQGITGAGRRRRGRPPIGDLAARRREFQEDEARRQRCEDRRADRLPFPPVPTSRRRQLRELERRVRQGVPRREGAAATRDVKRRVTGTPRRWRPLRRGCVAVQASLERFCHRSSQRPRLVEGTPTTALVRRSCRFSGRRASFASWRLQVTYPLLFDLPVGSIEPWQHLAVPLPTIFPLCSCTLR